MVPEEVNSCYTAEREVVVMPDEDVEIRVDGEIRTYEVSLEKDSHISNVE